jgi:hypothetical protein
MATRTDTATRNGPNKSGGQRPGEPAQKNVTPRNGGEAAPDALYGVVSVLYHALQGAQTYSQYAEDARRAGDEELIEFFETCRDEEDSRARMAKVLLSERIEDVEGEDSEEDEADEDDEEESASSDEDDDS